MNENKIIAALWRSMRKGHYTRPNSCDRLVLRPFPIFSIFTSDYRVKASVPH